MVTTSACATPSFSHVKCVSICLRFRPGSRRRADDDRVNRVTSRNWQNEVHTMPPGCSPPLYSISAFSKEASSRPVKEVVRIRIIALMRPWQQKKMLPLNRSCQCSYTSEHICSVATIHLVSATIGLELSEVPGSRVVCGVQISGAGFLPLKVHGMRSITK